MQVKCKGVTLNAKNASIVTPQSLQSLVRSYVANGVSDGDHLTTESEDYCLE
ncbi:hypothetical protein EXN66_Car013923 [Channa argus]|uniref:Uncharacterized protein n=1 Tax=Channa argus TaxID=215402 RepID=A0A6G1Q6V0_CHAAH|nr:hypothetical protein EXN66_Car013923 [Channa argus]